MQEQEIKPFEKKVWLSSPTMHGDEIKYVEEAYTTNWMSTVGANINEVEKEICSKIGCKHAVALASGTSALHLAIKLANVKPGDKVFCTDMTFSATVNPIVYEGGVPVFIDTEYDTWNMDPLALERAFEIYPDVKVVVLANLYGTPGKIDQIKEICDKHNAIIVEDAAESLGATYKNKQTGTFGKYNCISFNGNKIITGSSGGMLLTDDEESAKKVRKWSTQSRENAPWYQHEEIGYNYRMSNVIAGVIRGQIPYLEEHIAQKKAIYERYKEGLKNLPIEMNPMDLNNSEPNYWLSCMIIKPEAMCKQVRSDNDALYKAEKGKSCPTQILETLSKYNAEGRPIWKPMHMQPIFINNPFITKHGNGRAQTNAYINGESIDVGMDIFNRGLCLPSDNKMTKEEQNVIIEIIKSCFNGNQISASCTKSTEETKVVNKESIEKPKNGIYKLFLKRLFDILFSLILIILLSPLYLIISILVLIFMGWPILFKQPRPGKDEKIFNIYKFRTMTNKKDKDGNLLPDEQRLNKFGKFLRKTSLDELPEFFTILFGKMSFIGPRPLLVEYLPYYTEEEHHRHDVRPGLTGLAQVSGRNLVDWDERFKLDLKYVNNITLINDLKIIYHTIISVLKVEGINDINGNIMKKLSDVRKNSLMNYNVMILSAGRRVELVERFKKSAQELNINSKVIGVDISDLAPALYYCDGYELVPRINDEKYIDALLDVCKKHDIKLIVPTIDTELIKISENVDKFKEIGVLVNISTPDVIKICRNKKNTQKWLDENKIDAPRMITDEDLKNKNYTFPLFIKPLDGSSSINAFKIEDQKALDFFKDYVPNPIIQEMVTGEEYTIDAFCDFSGNPITIVPRKRLAVRAGEILKGIIDKDKKIIEVTKNLISKLKPFGHITIQCIKDNNDKVYILEINPRFGGGAPMSIDAGANSPKNLYRILMGEELKYNEDYKDKLYFSRFDNSIMIDKNEK